MKKNRSVHRTRMFTLTILTVAFLALIGVDAQADTTREVSLPFHYAFSVDTTTREIHPMEKSTSPYWWVNSGGYMYLRSGVGMTVQGELSRLDPRRVWYSLNNPNETDNGYHPQNIFRLVSRTKWGGDIQQEAYFKINRYNLSRDSHRAASNGLLLMNRYLDGDNLYYAGLRVDGQVVIKKKYQGRYYTLLAKQVLPGTYNRQNNPNLIPVGEWIGIRTEVSNVGNNQVKIKVYSDIGRTGRWTLIAETLDDGRSYGGSAIIQDGYVGIRTDFMDASFDNFRLDRIR